MFYKHPKFEIFKFWKRIEYFNYSLMNIAEKSNCVMFCASMSKSYYHDGFIEIGKLLLCIF